MAESPWLDPELVAASLREVEALQERLRMELTERLQGIHGEGDERFWRIVIAPWLLTWVPFVADIVARSGVVLDSSSTGSFQFADVPGAAARPVPFDTLASVELIKLERYGDATVHFLAGDRFEPGEPLIQPDFAPLRRGGLKDSAAAAAVVSAMRVAKSGQVVMYRASYLSRKVELMLAYRTRGAFLPLVAPLYDSSTIEVDPVARRRFSGVELGGGVLARTLSSLLPYDLPRVHLEGFPSLAELVETRYPPAPNAILSANAWYYDEAFKLWAARAAERGSLLVGVQHGGGSGVNGQLPADEHEITITDRYYSWGWQRENVSARVVPMPSPKLLDVERMPADNSLEGILCIGTVMPKNLPSLPYTDAWFERYLAWQIRFVSALAPGLRGQMRFRPHREDYGWGVGKRLETAAPEIAIESWDRPFYDSMRAARVLVVDHISTTWGEALGLGKPILLYWDPVSYPLRPEAVPVLDGLRDVGILHDTPESAAAELERAYADIESWWNEPRRQAAVAAFCEHYARTSPDGVGEWARELRDVARAERG